MSGINKQAADFFGVPLKKTSDVIGNVHSGTPNVMPWIPNRRREQPNERVKTFTKKAVPQPTGTTVPWSVDQVRATPSK
jgi:hypothetical protein